MTPESHVSIALMLLFTFALALLAGAILTIRVRAKTRRFAWRVRRKRRGRRPFRLGRAAAWCAGAVVFFLAPELKASTGLARGSHFTLHDLC
jgi:hypothetical protein